MSLFGPETTVEHAHIEGGRGAAGSVSQCSHLLKLYLNQCSKPICLAIGSTKTNFVCTPNSITHVY